MTIRCELKWCDAGEVIDNLDKRSFWVVIGVEARSQCIKLGMAGAMGLKYP